MTGLIGGGATFNPVNSNNGIVNWDILKVPKIAKAIGLVRSNLGSANFVFAGDSRTAGVVGSTPGSSNTTSSFPYYFYRELIAQGLPARYNTYTYGSTTAAGTGNSQITGGTGWSQFGSFLWAAPAALTNPYTFSPPDNITTSDIVYFDSAVGTIRWNYDGGANTDTALTGSGTYKKITATTTSGVHVLNVYMNAGFLGSVDCYDTTINDIRVKNLGTPGVGATGIVSGGSNSSQLKLWAMITSPDVYFVDLGTNDYGLNNPSQFQTSMGTIATTLVATGANLALEIPAHIPGQTEALQNSYDAGIVAVAGSTYPIFNMLTRYGLTYSQMSTNGWQNDALHPYQATYADQGGSWIAKAFTGKF